MTHPRITKTDANPKNARELMSDAKFYESYARFNNDTQKYETWSDAVERVMEMHRYFYDDKMTPELDEMITFAENAYKKKELLGAQRALQFGGDQLLKNNSKLYNCTATYVDRVEFFKEALFLMLSGCGIGFSVQKQHIKDLPDIAERTKQAKTFVVSDSIEGWADAVGVLMSSFFVSGGDENYRGRKIYFDLTEIRPKGAEISGGFKAPGPEPLRIALDKIELRIKQALKEGKTRLSTLDAYDCTMYMADAVISGGVRRAASICLFSKDDEEMITAKTGNWFIDNPQRGRSNNSVVLLRNETTKEEFDEIMKSVKEFGEPGFVWTDDLEILFNPCVEVGMYGRTEDGRSGWQVCNLTEINGSMSNTKEEFFDQCKAASILGTLQAGYTNFDYLQPASKEIIEREALIGVGITGWMNNPEVLFDIDNQRAGAEVVKKWNKITADLIGINQAARTTVVKPSGNASVLLGTASGIHGEHSKRYIRHVQMNKETEVAKMFEKYNPTMVEDSVWSQGTDHVIAFPIVAPKNSIYKSDLLGVKQLEYVKSAQENWIEYGTNPELCVKPFLKHNVSNTITVDDWDEVEHYIYDNRKSFCGVSLLPASGDKAFPQAPFTEVFTQGEITKKYGQVALFTSGLVEAGLNAYHNNLWTACSTAQGYGEDLDENNHQHLLKRDFVRRFKKFSDNFSSEEECANCLKDVYNLHKWWKIQRDIKDIDWAVDLGVKEFVDVDTLASQGCSGGNCEIEF
jgi:ribonucleoside-diphosphate reductase alpha chain